MEFSDILTSIHLSDYYHYIIVVTGIVGIFSFFFPYLIVYFLMIVSFGILVLFSGFILSRFRAEENTSVEDNKKCRSYIKQIEFLLIVSYLIACYIAEEIDLIKEAGVKIKEIQRTFLQVLHIIKKHGRN